MQAVVVLLGDMPFVKAELIDALADEWVKRGGLSAPVPTFDGRRGNPVVLSRALQRNINGLSGDVGAGPLLRGRLDVIEWPMADPAVAQDTNTRDDLVRHRL
jgi:molybdenum cofactor cytidylyltransferase